MLKRLLITGACGELGQLARSGLAGLAEKIRLSDINPIERQGPQEEVLCGDLVDTAFVDQLVDGCDAILHLGGVADEDHFETILSANIIGVHNLYRSAQKVGQPRIFFASSNHVVGFYSQKTHLDASALLRPDSYYGVSKCFGEAVAHMYHDKLGQETAIVRIGSCCPAPMDCRMLSTWLSPDDFISLIERVFTIPILGCPVIYGVSANDRSWWDNSAVAHLSWEPKDNAETYRDELDRPGSRPNPAGEQATYQGGSFAKAPFLED